MSYLELFEKPIEETIRKRVSCRTYQDRLLDKNDKERLLDFCAKLTHGMHGEKVSFHLNEHEQKSFKLTVYGLFRNARSFLACVIDRSEYQNLNCGYLGEHAVLKATEIGLGTCWVGYYNPYMFKDVKVSDEQVVPAAILVGYAAEKRSLVEKAARFAVRASARHGWDKLFFDGDFDHPLTSGAAGSYTGVLEMLRLAPSAGNSQPWRIVKEKGKDVFHFFKKAVVQRYEKRMMHDTDMGIGMCHFELAATNTGLQGRWEEHDPALTDVPENTRYVISWTQGT